jgi:hemerythrin-like domain-containing protein
MNDPMTILKADHREVKRLLTALAESEEGAEREKMCDEVTTALKLHMEIEEKILYPVVAKEIGAEDAEEADIEHGLAREGLRTMGSMVAKPGFGAAAEMLKGGITHHVEEEETELLPELKEKLDRADWLALGDAIAAAKAAAGAPVPPARRRRSAKRKVAAKR